MSKMSLRRPFGALLAAFSSLLIAPGAGAVPPGFVDHVVIPGWDQAIGLCFAPDGRGFVWEKAGRVWLVEDGVKSAAPLIDISEEVGNWRDLGLLGFAIDPNFYENGYIYLLYTVDYHHLRHFGTPQYNPAADQYFHDTIARLTRYTARASDGFRSVDPASRLVLVGETISTGFPMTQESHSVGTVLFGEDGTLLVGNGDGASFVGTDSGGFRPGSSNTALADGIITPQEDVGAFRSQMRDSLNGKILRLDPATGNGVPGNPFYDPASPRSARSRMWCMGMRNPFRFTIRPGTGSPHGTLRPGHLYIGDVGWGQYEEINVAKGGGENFGWPLFEGLGPNPYYFAVSPANLTAPNPLHGQGGCALPFFGFHHLIVQETLADPSWPNPCNAAQQVPASVGRFMHTRPALEWGHGNPVRVPVFDGPNAAAVELGSPESPVEGSPFDGSSSTGGVWYTAEGFPPEYRNTYFHGDFTSGWIRAFNFDSEGRLLSVRPFAEGIGGITCMAVNPEDECIYYVGFDSEGRTALRRIIAAADTPPIAVANAEPAYGPLPLTVSFSAEGSENPQGDMLTYSWDFGDSSPPKAGEEPTHTYTGMVDLTSQGTIVGRIFQLVPPEPHGGGNRDPEIIRDKDYPPLGYFDLQRQYDTFHSGQQGLDDWIGYTFASPQIISSLTFQEGQHFFDGGWFETLNVERRVGGVWQPVAGLVSSPPYAGNNGVNFDTYVFSFQPVLADGIRIRGTPGGTNRFISVAELRVGGVPPGLGNGPRRYDALLTVTDHVGATATASVVVSAANSPPQVQITSPVDGSLYGLYDVTSVPLRAQITDAEHAPGDLECRWQVILHHNTHNHPEPAITDCEPTVPLTPIGCDGETYSYEFRLYVTDAHGLETVRSSFVYPNCCRPDWDNDGVANSGDISAFLTSWIASVTTGTLVADFDGDGVVNSGDISAFLSGWILAVSGGDENC